MGDTATSTDRSTKEKTLGAMVLAAAERSDGAALRYKDGDEWKNTTSFGRDDIPVLNLVLQRAWEFILDAESNRGKDEAAE